MRGRAKKYSAIILLAFLILLVMACSVQAVDDINAVNQINDQSQNTTTAGPNLLWETVKLVFILGVIIAAAWFIIRIFSKQARRRLQGNWLHVVDEVMLGQNRGIVLCEVAQRLYALGVTDHNITFLFEIDNPQILKEISQMPLTAGEDGAEAHPLKTFLNQWTKGPSGSQRNQDEFHRLMEEQVGRIKSISLLGSGQTGSKGRSNADREPK
ncbi:MAG TPA: flagellar biosynthetic protein FliO [Syntrophomonadaceae bacterium]|nr:flagellar biosynthetic protein FliO [Syntrophomonadaceae bacterium]